MDPEERKIAALIAAFDTEHARVQGALAALNQTGARLQQEVKSAAASAVTAALKDLNQGIQEATRTLAQMRKYSLWRGALQHFMVALAAITVTLLAVAWYVPTPSEMNQLRAERDQLQASIEDLNKRGAKMKIIGCGPQSRLCVLVDRAAGTFGVAGSKDDVYMIVKGY
jgi:uncharacterized protein YukE